MVDFSYTWNIISSLKPDAFSRGFLSCNVQLPWLLCHREILLSLKKSLLCIWTSVHTKGILFTVGCIMWCQSFNKKNFLLGNMEKTPKSLGLLHLKSIEIWPLTSMGAELCPETTATRPQRGCFAQTLLIKRNNKFPKALGRRAYECLNASPCATSAFMLCCPHSVLSMVTWAKERLPT